MCVFLSEVAKGTREVTQNAQFILNGLVLQMLSNNCNILEFCCSFLEAFLTEYEEPLKMTFGEEDRDWLVSILQRELEVEDNEEKVKEHLFQGMSY